MNQAIGEVGARGTVHTLADPHHFGEHDQPDKPRGFRGASGFDQRRGESGLRSSPLSARTSSLAALRAKPPSTSTNSTQSPDSSPSRRRTSAGGQLVLIRQHRFDRHRAIGKYIMVAGPIVIASVSLLTVHSAARDAAAGTVDDLVVQNVTFTLELALLVLLAFVYRRNRPVHGAVLMSKALMFLVIALFFTFISYVPRYRIEGPKTFDRFAKSGQTSAVIGSVIGPLFLLRNVRTGWPWILVSMFFLLNSYLQMDVDRSGRTQPLTVLVGSIGESPAFGLGLTVFVGMLWMALKRAPTQRPAEREAV
jgi:hypothetical protein